MNRWTESDNKKNGASNILKIVSKNTLLRYLAVGQSGSFVDFLALILLLWIGKNKRRYWLQSYYFTRIKSKTDQFNLYRDVLQSLFKALMPANCCLIIQTRSTSDCRLAVSSMKALCSLIKPSTEDRSSGTGLVSRLLSVSSAVVNQVISSSRRAATSCKPRRCSFRRCSRYTIKSCLPRWGASEIDFCYLIWTIGHFFPSRLDDGYPMTNDCYSIWVTFTENFSGQSDQFIFLSFFSFHFFYKPARKLKRMKQQLLMF